MLQCRLAVIMIADKQHGQGASASGTSAGRAMIAGNKMLQKHSEGTWCQKAARPRQITTWQKLSMNAQIGASAARAA